jgi:hypothetical protein
MESFDFVRKVNNCLMFMHEINLQNKLHSAGNSIIVISTQYELVNII